MSSANSGTSTGAGKDEKAGQTVEQKVEAPNGTEALDRSNTSDVSPGHEVAPGTIVDPTPVERAVAAGHRDVIDPQVPTGQTPEQVAAELVPPDSNIELAKASAKRSGANLTFEAPQNRHPSEGKSTT